MIKKVAKTDLSQQRVALMLPCLNERLTLAKVIRDFRAVLPNIEVYVFDNGSTDGSAMIAKQEGAHLIHVPKRGKGHVVRKMFEMVEADLYVMVDSDDTYDATGLAKLARPVLEGKADMAVGSRVGEAGSYRRFHQFGNRLIIQLINTIFRSQFTDICSGYRVMSRKFVKFIPFLRDGFEVETELTVYSLICGFIVKEIPLPYRTRPANSHSKLNTFRDGYKVLLTIIWLARDLRPLLFFGLSSFGIFFCLGLPLYFALPQASLLHHSLAFFSISLLVTGLILNTLNIKFAELQLLYRRNFEGKTADHSLPHSTATASSESYKRISPLNRLEEIQA